MKTFVTVASEGIVVGLLLIVFVIIVAAILPVSSGTAVTSFVAGFLFHLTCEYTGVNKWYVDNYYA